MADLEPGVRPFLCAQRRSGQQIRRTPAVWQSGAEAADLLAGADGAQRCGPPALPVGDVSRCCRQLVLHVS